MTGFETELRERLRDSAAQVSGSDQLYERAEQRHRSRMRTRRVAGGLGAVAVLVAGAVAATSLVDAMTSPPDAPVVQEPDREPDRDPAPDDPTDPPGDAGWEELPPVRDVDDGWRIQHAAWSGDLLLALLTPTQGDAETARLVAYDDDIDDWAELWSPPGPPRDWEESVWTGDDFVVLGSAPVWSGLDHDGETEPSLRGLAYHPPSNEWRELPPAPLESRWGFSATWTGDELIVWGGMAPIVDDADGIGRTHGYDDGAAWDPDTNSWRALAASPLSPRGDHGAVWNGRRLVVFGGGHAEQAEGEFSYFDARHDAAAYDPGTDSWAAIQSPAEIGPLVASVWTGEAILYWTGHLGEDVPGNWLEPGGIWDPVTGESSPLPAPPFEARRDAVSDMWVEELGTWIVWGGWCGEGCNRGFADGAIFDPTTASWTPLSGPEGMVGYGSVGVWGDDRLFAVGGSVDFMGAQGEVVGGGWWRPSG